jgi:hypothetical protein
MKAKIINETIHVGDMQRLESLRAQLENEKSSFKATWRDLNDYIQPRRARFFVSDVNKGDRRNQKIIDSTATLAARTARSGMMGGITSPARPWFRLTTPDPALAEVASVKHWLHTVTNRMTTVFLKSNLYNVLPIIYGDLAVFGTACMSIEEDFEDTVRFYPFPIGSYAIAQNEKLKVDLFHRDFQMTVRQIINQFGRVEGSTDIDWSRISTHVKHLYMNGNSEAWVDVTHVIEPNPMYDSKKLDAKFKKYRSVYYERTHVKMNTTDSDIFLRESGFDYFPVLAPRWGVTGGDVYGTECPGVDAIGDIKQLQLGEKRSAQALEKMINPPMVGPTALRNQKASILPGDITYTDEREGSKGFRPAHEIRFDISQLEAKQQQIRERVSRAFYEDLFLMLANTDRRQITAREIEERHHEKLLALGPVLEQLNQDLLDPLIDNTFYIMDRQGMVPEPPEELQGIELKVEYISIMAQAQKLVGLGGIERFSSYVGNLMQVSPEVRHKVNFIELVDVYGDLTSIPPGILKTDEEAFAAIQAEQEALQQQQQQEAMMRAAPAARELSQTNLEGDNALNRLLEQSQAGQIAPQ